MNVAAKKDLVGRLEVSIQESDDRLVRSGKAGEWKTDALDPLAPENLHVQQVVRARMGEREGMGVLEQLCLGPHAPSGFTEFLDGAR